VSTAAWSWITDPGKCTGHNSHYLDRNAFSVTKDSL
jgi:hypothetical protein